jgi:hypothetical protein
MPAKLVGCSLSSRRGPSRTGRSRRSELAGQRPALPVVGARMGVNLAKLKRIKVDQGEIFKNVEDQDETESCPANCGDEPSPPRRMRMDENLAKLKPIKVDQGEKNKKVEAQGTELRRVVCRGFQRIRLLTPALSSFGEEREDISRCGFFGALTCVAHNIRGRGGSLFPLIEISPAGLFPLHSQ